MPCISRPFQALVTLVVTGLLGASAVAAGVITNLGTLGGPDSFGLAINAGGQVTGVGVLPVGAAGDRHAFLYDPAPGGSGLLRDLGTLGGSVSSGEGVNARGQVVGGSRLRLDIDTHAFLYTPAPGGGGSMADLGTLGGFTSTASGVNAAGQVAGSSDTVNDFVNPSPVHAFVYGGPGGGMADLGTLGGFNSYGAAINDAGQIAGHSNTIGNLNSHAFVYTPTPGGGGSMADLGTIGGTDSVGLAINAAGQVAGFGNLPSDSNTHAFLYTPDTPAAGGGRAMADLGTLGGLRSIGAAVNAAGQVVGVSDSSPRGDQHAFLYVGAPGADGRMIDLDAWLDAAYPAEGARWTLTDATGLTDGGLITGYGTYDDGPGGLTDGIRAYVLDAGALVPEPTGLAPLGLVAVGLRRRRRGAGR